MLNFFNEKIFTLQFPILLLIIIFFFLIVGIISWRRKYLTILGSISAAIVGMIVFFTLRLEGILLIGFFFISANIIERFTKGKYVDLYEKKGSTRDEKQVIANSFFAVIAALGWFFSYESAFLVMYGAVIAEAVSDTWASGIGRLSRQKPINIRNFRQVDTGLSGGITVLGTVSALIGAIITSIIWFLFFKTKGALIVGAMGFAGCIVDSILGACVQGHYWNEEERRMTEKEYLDGKKLELCQGLRWVDNDMVNFLSTVFSGVFALGMINLIN